MTFLELQNEVLLYLDELDDVDVTRSVVKQALNQANRQRALEQDWSWMLKHPPVYQTLEAGTRSVQLPTDLRRVQRLYNVTRNFDYQEVPEPGLGQYALPSARNTLATLFHVRGENPRELVFFAPPEGDEVEIHYYRNPVTLSGDSDLPDLPAAHHDLLVWDALLRLKAYHNDADAFAAFRDFQREAHEALLFTYSLGAHTVGGQPTYIRYIP